MTNEEKRISTGAAGVHEPLDLWDTHGSKFLTHALSLEILTKIFSLISEKRLFIGEIFSSGDIIVNTDICTVQ
jgi:hypothetical protein